jgi:ankyrin repeat protein
VGVGRSSEWLGANAKFKDQIKQTILFYIARDGRGNIIEYLVNEKQLDINDYDLYGQTPLFYSSRENKLECVKKMIELGCNVNHIDSLSSQTALFYCAREGHTEMCRILIDVWERLDLIVKNGCKPSHQDASRKTAAFYAKKFNKKETIELLNNYMSKQKEVSKEQESAS